MWIAPTGEIHVLTIEVLYIYSKWSRIMTSANLIWSFLNLNMKFYGVDEGLQTYMRSICSLGYLHKWLKMTCAENGLETIHDKCVEIRVMAIY